jgi:hypothetical protein
MILEEVLNSLGYYDHFKVVTGETSYRITKVLVDVTTIYKVLDNNVAIASHKKKRVFSEEINRFLNCKVCNLFLRKDVNNNYLLINIESEAESLIDTIRKSDDIVAIKVWTLDDVAVKLSEMGYETSEENISKVFNTHELNALEDCTDEDWSIIEHAIASVSEELDQIRF